MSQESKSSLFWGLIIFSVGVLVVAGLWLFKPQPAKRPFVEPEGPIVDVISAKLKPHTVKISSQGTLAPRRKINLVSEVSGRVIKVSENFISGGAFQANDVLVQLDDRDYKFALANAKAQVANAERELALEKGQARQAKRVWRDLGSSEANSLSLREPQIKAAIASLNAARAEQQRAQLNIERAAIVVPFTGRVESTSVDLGEFVPAGSVLGQVFDSTAVDVRLPINSEQMQTLGLSPGTSNQELKTVKVVLSAVIGGKFHEWQANLNRIEAVIDNRTRLYHVVAEVMNPFDLSVHSYPLVVGLFVKASLSGNVIDNVIQIPKKAVIEDHVYVVGEDNILSLVDVVMVDHGEDSVWVKGDLNDGDNIVVSDPRILQEGLSVKIKDQSKKEFNSIISKENISNNSNATIK